MFVIAHLSDVHLDCGARALDRTRQVMSYLNALPGPIDAILVSGDIADHGEPAEYEQARAELVADVPVLILPGNHDVRPAYRRVLLDGTESTQPINQAQRVGKVLFALCDSSTPGRDDGLLTETTLAWLADLLAGTDRDTPVFICMHHPPAALHEPLIDGIRLSAERPLADLIEGCPQVVAVLCGHAHTPAASTFAGRPLLVAPGVASMLRLPWESGGAADFASVIDHNMPPAIAFHVLGDDGRLTTHFRLVP